MGVNVPSYKWSKTVKELDGNECAFCGSTIKLEAHHIQQKAANEGLATDLENGITLCHKCHYTAHGANYTTDGRIGSGYRGFSADPKVIQAFIAEYAGGKVVIAAPQGTKERWKEAAADRGKSLNQFIVDAVESEIGKGGKNG